MRTIRQLHRQLRFAPGSEVLRQLDAAGYSSLFTERTVAERSLHGRVELQLVPMLRRDARFKKGGLHRLHPEISKPRIDFRALSGTFGKGSLQIVIGKETGQCHCDVDRFNPYEDVVNVVGHAGEVLGHWWKRLWA